MARESLWLNSEFRKAPEFKAISMSAFGLWTQLVFLADDDHTLPGVTVIARDSNESEGDVVRLMTELVMGGFVQPLPSDGRYRMTAFSQRFYSFTEPEDNK